MLQLFQRIIDDILWPSVLVVFIWVAYFVNFKYNLDWNQYGIKPHELIGLRGIIFSPFLHGDFSHLLSNSLPLIVSGGFIFHFYQKYFWKMIFSLWMLSGIGTWILGSTGSTHIGASGLIYGMIFFLLITGFIRKNKNLLGVSLLLVFLYGSLVWGIFPEISEWLQQNISWEGHLAGAVSGILMALILRNVGPSDDPDPFINEEMPQWWMDMQQQENLSEQEKQPPTIHYIYKETKKDLE